MLYVRSFHMAAIQSNVKRNANLYVVFKHGIYIARCVRHSLIEEEETSQTIPVHSFKYKTIINNSCIPATV